MTFTQSIAEGRKWARANPDADRSTVTARLDQYRAAWGDDAAHGFWRGLTDEYAVAREAKPADALHSAAMTAKSPRQRQREARERAAAARAADLARATEQPGEVLDFEVAPIGNTCVGHRFEWVAFDARDGKPIVSGEAATAEAARLAALTFIARRNVSRCHVLRHGREWLIFLPLMDAFAPLPLTGAATVETVRAHVAGLPIAKGRPVVITHG